MELNKVYCIDNLELLQHIPDESIDLIYCDILYNTGRKFRDYDDKLGSPHQAIVWYHPRLSEMHRVLRPTGSLHLQMDWRLSHYIKVELDSIFGFDNFRNEIVWHYSGIKRPTAKKFPQKHDIILSYTKSSDYYWQTQYKPHKPEYLKRFKPDESGRLCRTDVNQTVGGNRKIYLDDVEGDIVDSVWDDIPNLNPASKDRTGYDTQKPTKLLERILLSSCREGDVVADFFCGSGSTLVAAKSLGRKFIGCDISQKAVDITNQRLQRLSL